MAKRQYKGKSTRRVKDWQARHESGQDLDDTTSNRLRFTRKEVKLREDSFADEANTPEEMQRVAGMVTGVFRRGTYVRVAGEELYCSIAKTYRPPDGFENTSPLAVGDDVTVALGNPDHTDGQTELDRNRMDGRIVSRQPRRTLLGRPEPRSSKRRETYDDAPFEKIIAANMDALLIVAATAQPAMSSGLLDRFLIAAERGEMSAIIAVNKIDVAAPDQSILSPLRQQGVTIVPCSAATGEGLDEIRAILAGRRTVLAGASGVGKSTLVNALLPGTEAVTRTVRAKDDRGRHTTSQSRIYDLPAQKQGDKAGLLVDTPGIRELAVPIPPEQLLWYFPEFQALSRGCRFRNCTHTHEPSCAVRDAVEHHDVVASRYESYLRILETLEG